MTFYCLNPIAASAQQALECLLAAPVNHLLAAQSFRNKIHFHPTE